MEALFTNPLTMLAGAALVSAPILIHLINRMRFRRVKWAAMEFLIKAQKRMRRKLIIEQLILLLLRCLLVFLVGLLLARFKWFNPSDGGEGRATAHVVILDDTPSMADASLVEGRQTTAFDQAKFTVTDRIAPAAAQANTPQSLDLVLLSDLAAPRAFARLNDTSIQDARSYLAPLRPSAVRVSLIDGLRKAKQVLDGKPDSEVAKVIHVVSDLRAIDWTEDGEAIKQLVTELTAAGTKVHLIDVAHPFRKDTDRQPRSSDNVGIVEFRPKARTVARGHPVEFELRVKNFGNTELKDVRIEFYLNGRRWNEVSVRIASLPANQEVAAIATATTGLERLGTKDNPLDRFNLITAMLAEPEAGGIAADNVRHAVVEVQERLAVLVLEGRERERNTNKSDGFYLKRLFQDAFGGINWVEGTLADLDKQDLRTYAAIYMVNVPGLTDSQREKLEGYVRGGGGLGVFLGPDVRPADYNKVLYRAGEGLFPLPLPDQPTPPLTDEQKNKVGRILSKRILVRDSSVRAHPAVVGLYTGDRGDAVKSVEVERYFMFANIDQYWPIKRFGKWLDDRSVRELYCLPNEQPMAQFQGPARDVLDKLKSKAAEPKYEKYRVFIDPLDKRIRATTADDKDPLSLLADLYDRLLCDQINDGDPSEPILREFWGLPEMTDLRAEFQRERDRAKYGDPLYLVREYKRGRVAVMTTDAGGAHPSGRWTDWPSGAGAPGWLAVVAEMQKYLAGGAVEENRSVGTSVAASFEAAKYKPTASRVFVTASPTTADKAGNLTVSVSKPESFPLEPSGGALAFRHPGAKEPGVELWTFTSLVGPNAEIEKPEYVSYTYNIDSLREGDLRRAARDDLALYAPKAPVYSADDTSWVNNLKQKRDDFSTRRWLYLFILLVLITEQAMAVRLSFHTRPEDVDQFAPSAAVAYARGTAPAPAEDAAVAPVAETAGV